MTRETPELLAKIDGERAAKVVKDGDAPPLYVWRLDDGQLRKWSTHRENWGPKDTNAGIMNVLNSHRVEVEYIPMPEVPCLDDNGDERPFQVTLQYVYRLKHGERGEQA